MNSNDKTFLEELGLKIGHYTDIENLTGLTAFIFEKGAKVGIDIRGSNTGTLNTPAFSPLSSGEIAHAIVLTGGSTFGLESAFGVMKFLEEKNIGNLTRAGIIPGITGAVIYDIGVGNKVAPTKDNGYKVAELASFDSLGMGNIGVGTGATTGKWFKGRPLKGGFGYSVTRLNNGVIVAAFVVTNAVGDVINPKTNKFYSESGGYAWYVDEAEDLPEKTAGLIDISPSNTTLAVIATNVDLDKNQLIKISELSHDGMARAINPVHTSMDGDVIFSLSTSNTDKINLHSKMTKATVTDYIGLIASDTLINAINNSMINAEDITGFDKFRPS